MPVRTKTRFELACHDPLVAGVLVALELADQPAAVLAVEQAADGHQVRVVLEESEGDLEEVRGDGRVGVHHQDDVARRRRRQQPGQLLVERAGLLLGVADGLDHLDAVRCGRPRRSRRCSCRR